MTQLDEFAAFCRELTLDIGRPMELEPFQQTILTDFFDGVRETLVLIPKKNGKTHLLAALGLYHLLSEPEAACYAAAASRDQASLIYGAACGFVERSPDLRKQIVVRKGYRELWTADGSGKFKVLASDVDTGDGVLPSLVLCDELHRHRSDELYGILADGLGPRQGQMVTISTAGDDEGSPLGKLREKAHAQPGQVRDGAHRYVRTEDFAMHEWALDAEDDLDDLELVKTANPASWQTIEELRRRKESPSMTPWRWARFAAGVWVFGADSAISDKEWASCADPGIEIPSGTHGVWAGLDLAWRHDTTAAVPIWQGDEEEVIVHPPSVIHPPGDGTSIDAEEVWSMIEEMAAKWPDLTIVADPNAGAPELLQRIERDLPHVRLAEMSQAPHLMALAAGRLQESIGTGKLRHPDDEELNRHVLAAVPVSVGEGYRFRKSRKDGPPIDALIALAMAHAAMLGEEPPEPEPEYRSMAWQNTDLSEASRPRRRGRDEYIPCRGCEKPIHPALHEPDRPEDGHCLDCRTAQGML